MMPRYVQTENKIANHPIENTLQLEIKVEKKFPVTLWNTNCVLKGPFEFEIKYVRANRT